MAWLLPKNCEHPTHSDFLIKAASEHYYDTELKQQGYNAFPINDYAFVFFCRACRGFCYYVISIMDYNEKGYIKRFEKLKVEKYDAPTRTHLDYTDFKIPKKYIENAKKQILGSDYKDSF